MARRSGCLFTVGALCGLALLVAVPVVIGARAAAEKKEIAPSTTLEIRLDGGMSEAPGDELMAALTGASALSVWDLRRGLRRAAEDDRIDGLLIEVHAVGAGFGALDEWASEIARFRESGKPVHAILETDMVQEKELLAAVAAEKIWMSPEALVLVNGLQADVEFWKGTLDKLHVEPDYIMFKEYKSAGEPFSRTEMSEHFREALTDVLGDIQDHAMGRIAEAREVSPDALSAFVDRGVAVGAQALSAGLIDELGYLDQARAAVGGEDYEGLSLGAYLEKSDAPALPTVDGAAGPDKIALIFGEGPIVVTDAGGSPFAAGGAMISGRAVAASFREAIEEDSVKAIVFRVSSPGGSAVGSDLIWREIQRAREAGKPVVVSMSDVAGSGGYWVSMGADAIVAQPSTITGSIGVVFGKMNLRGFYTEWLGANVESVSFARNADILSPFATLNDEQRAALVGAVGAMYGDFVGKVADGRGMERAAAERLARGRIWSGVDALENGLVDALGGLDTAATIAREKGGLSEDVELVVFPEPKPLLQRLLEGDLQVQAPSPDPRAALEAMLDELGQPGVWAVSPEIEIH